MKDILISLSEEELKKVPVPTDEEIDKAIQKGIENRKEFLKTAFCLKGRFV